MADSSSHQTSKLSLSSSHFFSTSIKASSFAYGITFAFIAFTSFLAFTNPSGFYSLPFSFNSIFYFSETPKTDSSPQMSINASFSSEMGINQSSKPIISLSKQSNHTISNDELLMNDCDLFDGRWVKDDSYPLYAGGFCPYIDESFNCFLNSRPDFGYEKYRWQPRDCNLPRIDGRNMLRLLRGKRLVFIGDSLNRNMWESLVCILRNSVDDKSRVFEASGSSEFRTAPAYSFILKDYNCSVEFVQSPFLVQESVVVTKNGSKKETLHLDMIQRSLDNYKNADILVFNTGHWWTHEKTSRG